VLNPNRFTTGMTVRNHDTGERPKTNRPFRLTACGSQPQNPIPQVSRTGVWPKWTWGLAVAPLRSSDGPPHWCSHNNRDGKRDWRHNPALRG
jgi:hypothetical protein